MMHAPEYPRTVSIEGRALYDNLQITRRIIDAFRRHHRLFFYSLLTLGGVIVLLLLLMPKTYGATAITRVTRDEVAASLGLLPTPQNIYISQAQQNANQFMDLMKDDRTGGFVDQALKQAELVVPINVDPKAGDKRLALLRKRLYAMGVSEEMFVIGLAWDNPGECERIVRSLQKQYVEAVGEAKRARSLATEKFLTAEIEKYEQRMRRAEQALIEYKQENMGQLPEAEGAIIEQLEALRSQLDDLQVVSRDGDLKRQALLKRIGQINPTSILEQTVGDDPVIHQLKELETERALLLVDYKPGSDEIQTIDARIAAVRKILLDRGKGKSGDGKNVIETKIQDNPEYRDLMQQLTEAEIAQKTQNSQMELLRQKIGEYMTRISKMPAAQRHLTDRTRDYSILKEQYEDMLKQREQAQIKGNLDRVSARANLSQIGNVYAEATTGGKKLILLCGGGGMLALLLSLGLVFLREWMDPSLRYEYDAERQLGLPVLATIPDDRSLANAWWGGTDSSIEAAPGGGGARPADGPATIGRKALPDSSMSISGSDSNTISG